MVEMRRPGDTCPSSSRMATRVLASKKLGIRGGCSLSGFEIRVSQIGPEGYEANWLSSLDFYSSFLL